MPRCRRKAAVGARPAAAFKARHRRRSRSDPADAALQRVQHPIIPSEDGGISSPQVVDTKELANGKKSPEEIVLQRDPPVRSQKSYQSKSINSVGRRPGYSPKQVRHGPPPVARGPTDPDTIARHAENKRKMALITNAYKAGGEEAMQQCIKELQAEDRERDRLDGSMDCSPPLAALNGPLRGEANG